MSILIVDDEIECRDSLGALLELSGYSVIKASDGEEALGILKKMGDMVCLMLVDFLMPGMNGGEFIGKAHEAGHRQVAIVVTAASPAETAGLAGMGVGCIRKPYDGKTLLGTIEKMLGKEREGTWE